MPNPRTVALVLASHMPERKEGRFVRANFVIRSMAALAVEVLGGLAARCALNCPAVDGLELSLIGAEGNVV